MNTKNGHTINISPFRLQEDEENKSQSDDYDSDSLSSNEYINHKINNIYQPMIAQMIIKQPKDPIKFMIDWLEKCSGEKSNSNYITELKDLRKKHQKYLRCNNDNNTHDNEENYYDNSAEEDSDSVEDTESMRSFEIVALRNNVINRRTRNSVSAEAHGIYNPWKPHLYPLIKNNSRDMLNNSREIIESIIKRHISFSCFDITDYETLFNSWKISCFSPGEIIIRKDEEINAFYIVLSGTIECYQNDQMIMAYEATDYFGEIGLLYNTICRNVIICKTKSMLISIDRETYNALARDASIKRLDKHVECLMKVGILKKLTKENIIIIAEALVIKKYSEGAVIISEDDDYDSLYIIDEGCVYETDSKAKGKTRIYNKGDYFGENALIKNMTMIGNLIADTDCSLNILQRKSYERLLDPISSK